MLDLTQGRVPSAPGKLQIDPLHAMMLKTEGREVLFQCFSNIPNKANDLSSGRRD